MRVAVAALALVLAAGAATAADHPTDPKALVGEWTLSPMAEGPEVCNFTMDADSTDGGYTLHIPFSCYRDFDVDDVTAWGVDADGAILFKDRRGRTLHRFDPVPVGGYGATEPGWSLDRREREQRPPMSQQELMSGVWRITGLGGASLCAFDLTSNAAGTAGTLKVKPGCSGEWATKTWSRWTLRKRELTLFNASGQPVVAFRQDEDRVTFERRDPIAEARGRITDLLFFARDFED